MSAIITAGYQRRPPFAQHKLLSYDGERVRFWYKDTKTKQRVVHEYSANEFIDRLVNQVPDRYRHGVHYFGLLAPRCKGQVYEVLRALLKQKRRPRPPRTRWRKLIWLTFRKDPLLTPSGEVMQKIGWKATERSKAKLSQVLRR
ncbi:MAG: transposase [Terracidiphilus sp.]